MPTSVLVVFTARGKETILAEGGSQAWSLNPANARKCEYVICVQNRGFKDDWGSASAPHKTAFLIGKISAIVPSTEQGSEGRFMIQISDFSEINIPDSWDGLRNPVHYSTLDKFIIDISNVDFHPVVKATVMEVTHSTQEDSAPMTIEAAKKRLAATFGVSPSNIDITIRG